MAEQDGILFDRVERTACPGCHAEIDVAALEPFSRAACPECGAELTVPAHLANYQLMARLGSGGMGSVYRAYDETLAREVAIKVMRQSLGSQPEFLESFRREAQAAARLNHPNIAQIYSFGEEKGQPYIVMEYVPGKHLEDMIEGPDVLDQKMVMKIGLDIAGGLQMATASNLIHGDIKPGNILMDDRNSAKLVDFGIASSPDAEQTEIWGTPYYIAPEKVKREKIDFRSDMYCLGGTLYHAITKKPPFDGEDAMAVVKARLAAPARPMREIRKDVDPEVERIIMRTLELDPAKRYASYGDLMADITAYLSKGKANSSSKKIIIKSRASRGLAQDGGEAGATPDAQASSQNAPAPHPTLHVPGDGVVLPQPEGEEEPKKSSALKWVVALLVLVLVAGGVTLGVMLNAKSKAREKEAADKAALIASQGAVMAPLEAARKSAEALAKRVAGQAEAASGIVAGAIAAVERAEGGEWTERITAKPTKAPKVAEPAEAPAVEAAENAGDAEAKPEGDQAGESNEVAEVADGEESAETAEPAGTTEEAEAPAETQDVEGVEEVEKVEEVEEAGEPSPEADDALEGLPLMAREIFLMLEPVRKAAALAGRVGKDIGSHIDNAAGIAPPDQSLDLAAIGAAVERNKEAISVLAGKAEKRLAALEKAADGLDALVGEARAKLAELNAAADAAIADAERRVAEAKAAADEKAEKERQEAEEAAKKAAEETELASVRAIVPAHLENIANWKFDPIIREFDKVEGKLASKSARKALKVERRRVDGLKNLKDFLVAHLSGDDKFVHPRARWSVVSADARSVEVKPAHPKDAKPQRMKWGELKPDQIVPMLIHYLGDKDKAKAIPLRERVNAYIDTAVYFIVVRGDDPHAVEAAKAYCERAIEEAPSRRQEVIDTLYELDFAGE